MTNARVDSDYSLFVITARYLVSLYVLLVVADWLGVVTADAYVSTRAFFAVAFAFGSVGVGIWYYPHVEAGYRAVRGRIAREHFRDSAAISILTLRNMIVIVILVIWLSFAVTPLYVHIDFDLLYAFLVVVLVVTLALYRGRSGLLATKAGALAVTPLILLLPFSSTVRSAAGTELYVLAGVLVALTLWKERERLRTLDRRERLSSRVTVVGLGVLLVVASVLYFYRLRSMHLYGDEHQVVEAAAGFYHTGEFVRWDWHSGEPVGETTDTAGARYDRAWPHTVLIAASYEIFGISVWSSRLPSVLAGLSSVLISYYCFRFFTELRSVAFAGTAGVVLAPALIYFFRWTRMYSLVVPLTLVLAYLLYRITTERNTIDFRNERVNTFVETHLDFHIGLGLATLPLLYLGYAIHRNVLVVVPVAYLFVLYRYHLTRERRYAVAAMTGLVGLFGFGLIATITDRFQESVELLSFFGRDNTVYISYLFQYPLQTAFGLIFFTIGLAAIHQIRAPSRRDKLVFLYIFSTFSIVFYVYIGDRYASVAYIVHVLPIVFVLVLYTYREFVLSFRTDWIRFALVAVLLLGLIVPFHVGHHGHDYERVYYGDQDFSTTYGTIADNYSGGDEAVFLQFPRRYYLDDLDEDADVIDMERDQEYSPEEFYQHLDQYESGWFAWETIKSRHIDPEILNFIEENFEHHHGDEVDGTGIEVYYFDEDMVDEDDL